MDCHILSAEDEWFIKKGQKDSLSRTPFEVGQAVVVCDNRHVMLAEFYDGKCPTCNSHKTVPFTRQNVELGILRSYTGKCQQCSEEITLLLRQCGANNPFVGKCPKCNNTLLISERIFEEQASVLKFRKYINRINIALGLIWGLLVICIIVFTVKGYISNDDLTDYSKSVIFPRTQQIYKSFFDFLAFDRFYSSFTEVAMDMREKNIILGRNVIESFSALFEGFKILSIGFGEQLRIIIGRTNNLIELFVRRTRILMETIRDWLGSVISKV